MLLLYPILHFPIFSTLDSCTIASTMKLKFLIPIVFLLAFTSSEKLQPPGPDIAHANRLHDLDLAEGNAVLHDRANAATGAVTVESWDKAKELGRKLRIGMIKDDKEAAQLFDPNSKTVQSVFDGDLKETLEKWGYNEPPPEKTKIDKECDFDAYHHIKTAFDDLGIDTRSKGNGGPNECFEIDHANGPKVLRDENGQLPPVEKQKYIDESCGKEYRVSRSNIDSRRLLTLHRLHGALSSSRSTQT